MAGTMRTVVVCCTLLLLICAYTDAHKSPKGPDVRRGDSRIDEVNMVDLVVNAVESLLSNANCIIT